MFKRLRLQNLIFYAIAAYIVVMIISQQSLVDSHTKSYEDALRENEAAKKQQVELLEQKKHVNSDESKEENAREEGYVDADETVFIYEFKTA